MRSVERYDPSGLKSSWLGFAISVRSPWASPSHSPQNAPTWPDWRGRSSGKPLTLASRPAAIKQLRPERALVRTRTWREYLVLRDEFEERSVANLENVWNGRPISKLLLADPLQLSESASVELVELIPPFHQRVYRMGLEHFGFVVGADLDDFSRRHRAALTGQQFQSSEVEPVCILFDDYTHVKFHQRSLKDACEREGRAFVGFQHVDWHPVDELVGPYEVA